MVPLSKQGVYYMLSQFKHGNKTDFANGIINNQDACLIAMWYLIKGNQPKSIRVTSRQLKDALQAWRPGLKFTYLFNTSMYGGHGFVGSNYTHAANRLTDYNGRTFLRKTFWHRRAKGQYCITGEGFNRLKALDVI